MPDTEVVTEFVGLVPWEEAEAHPERVVRLIDESVRITVDHIKGGVYLRVEYNHLPLDLLRWLRDTHSR